MKTEEHDLQCTLIQWLRLAYPGTLYTASIAGQYSTPGQRRKAWRAGYVNGTPDVFIYEPRGGKHGLHIELKSRAGRQTKEQKAWQVNAELKNYVYILPRTIDQAIREIMEYMGVAR